MSSEDVEIVGLGARAGCPNGHMETVVVDETSPRFCGTCGTQLQVDPTHATGGAPRQRFDDAVFVSFTHLDNQPAGPAQKRFIDEFYGHLKIRLSELFGDQVDVFKDERLRGNDSLDLALRERLKNVAVLVSITSPRYLKSEWCQWELQEFSAMAEESIGLYHGSQSRVFKAVKTPVPLADLPEQLAECIGYEFFDSSDGDRRVREFLRNPIEQERWKFYAKVDDVAEDVAELLEDLGYDPTEKPVETPVDGGVTIFLAETAPDMTAERDDLKRELERRGHRIVPDKPLPLDADELEPVVLEELRRADFAIHPLGGRYGARPDGDDRSVPHIQLDAGRELAALGGLTQLIWIPDEVEAKASQADLLEHVQTMDVGHKTEVVRAPLSLFKSHLFECIDKPEPVALTPAPSISTRIYLVCDQPDYDEAAKVRAELEAQGFIVDLPVREGTEAEIREIHEMSMVLTDAVLIYYGTASEHWVRLKLFDMFKARGWGRSDPYKGKGVLVAGPMTEGKSTFSTGEAFVLDATQGFTPDVVAPYVAHLKGGGDA